MADLASALRAAPIGLLMLLGTYLAARRRRNVAARAVVEMPEVARRLGLEFRPPSAPGNIGGLRGTHRGHEVFVDADDRPRIVVYFAEPPPFILRTYEHEKRTPGGMERFDFRRPLLDGFFKERYGEPDAVDRLLLRAARLDPAVQALAALADRVAHVSITPERIECAFAFGRPNHVPAHVTEELVPVLTAMAAALGEG